jgi:hypothetical protein
MPYTFNAFTNFLIQNHCAETLDFISEAKAYPEIYSAHWASPDNSVIGRDSALVGMQWNSLMETYIVPGSPSEVNLPAYIREQLLGILDVTESPPHPEQLNSAVNHAYEILTQDALMPFIKSLYLADDTTVVSRCLSRSTLYYPNVGRTLSQMSGSMDWNDLYDTL